MKYLTAILLLVLLTACSDFELQEGDIIFQQAPEAAASQTEKAIQEVTGSIEGYNFTHVGIVGLDENGGFYVLEAIPPRVKITPLDEYLYPAGKREAHPRSVVARLKPEYAYLIPDALVEGKKLVGLDYDHAYRPGDNRFYCSEYIYEIFRRANHGKEFFTLTPMTFRSPQTGEISDGWRKHFEEFGLPVPEGEPGTNPGAMSRSDVLEIVHKY